MERVRGAPAVVIGGGFYGCCIALHLAQHGYAVTLLEREADLLERASYRNQARLHGGYHYPRSYTTAYRSRLNFARFTEDFQPAVVAGFTKVYAVARRHSKVSPRQFEVFCALIGAPLRRVHPDISALFSARCVAAVYEVEEYAFNAAVLRTLLRARLDAAGVRVITQALVTAVEHPADDALSVTTAAGDRHAAAFVCNCTYAGLNHVRGIARMYNRVKQEITEMALVRLPAVLGNLSVTMMDGPFFSFMPFPDRGLTTFSHVRYTPRTHWLEEGATLPDPYARCDEHMIDPAFAYMRRDAARFMPDLARIEACGRLLEVKTVLGRNEIDDGRPILFQPDPMNPRIVSILGSKIDNVYDALLVLDRHLAQL